MNTNSTIILRGQQNNNQNWQVIATKQGHSRPVVYALNQNFDRASAYIFATRLAYILGANEIREELV